MTDLQAVIGSACFSINLNHIKARLKRRFVFGQPERRRTAQTILLEAVNVLPSLCEAVGAALDALAFEHVIGCIGGDDTIIIVVKSVEKVPEVMRRLEEAIRK